MTDDRWQDEIDLLLSPADADEQASEARWLKATTRALPARRRSWRAPAIALAAAVLLLLGVLRFTMPSRGPDAREWVELDVSGAARAIADGRPVEPARCRFRERLELDSAGTGFARLTAGADSIWWRGPLVLVTERDPGYSNRGHTTEEENMPRKMVRIGKWTLAVLAGSITFRQPTADATPSPATDARTAMAPPIPAPDPVDPAGKVVVPGRVLDADGKPFEGAHVCAVVAGLRGRRAPQELAATATDADGRFTIAFDPKSCSYWDVDRPEPWRYAQIVDPHG
jgi:hypothetical protein